MKKIFFHHIPRTVGTALVQQAEALFGDRVCPARFDQEMHPGMIEDERYLFYHGHFSQAVVQRFRRGAPEGFVFTFLRHPFARVLSQYRDWSDHVNVFRALKRIGATHPDGTRFESARFETWRINFENSITRLSLDEFLAWDDRDGRRVASNPQAQYLTDERDAAPLRMEKAVVGAMMTYDFIGVQELYAPCVRIIEAKCALPPGSLGGKTAANATEHAKTDGPYEVTPRQMEAIEVASAYDLAIYHAFYGFLLRDHADYLPPHALDIIATIGLPLIRPVGLPLSTERLQHRSR